MAMMSRKAKYALAACLFLARHETRGPRLIAEIAEVEQIPRKFLELILLELKNARVLASKKGKHGGYALSKPAREIKVGDVMRIIDGPLAPLRCASRSAPLLCDDCPDPNLCGIRELMSKTRDAISGVVDTVSLEDVNRRIDVLKELNPSSSSFETGRKAKC